MVSADWQRQNPVSILNHIASITAKWRVVTDCHCTSFFNSLEFQSILPESLLFSFLLKSFRIGTSIC